MAAANVSALGTIERLLRPNECKLPTLVHETLTKRLGPVMKKNKSVWTLLKATMAQWVEDQPFQLSSSLSYYTLFSLAPLLIIVIAIAGFAFEREAAEHQIVGTIQGMVGQHSAEAIQGMLQNASSQPKTGMISAAIGVVTLILGAGGVVGQLQTSLNMIWGVALKPGQGVLGFIRQRFISFAMVLGIGFLLLVSLVVSAVVTSDTICGYIFRRDRSYCTRP